jgi:hypothetical protein
VTHMALLLSLADNTNHLIGLHLVNMIGYASPCLADRPADCSYARFCYADAPPVPSLTEPQVHTAYTPSPSCLLVVVVLKVQHLLPGRLDTIDLPHTHFHLKTMVCM